MCGRVLAGCSVQPGLSVLLVLVTVQSAVGKRLHSHQLRGGTGSQREVPGHRASRCRLPDMEMPSSRSRRDAGENPYSAATLPFAFVLSQS